MMIEQKKSTKNHKKVLTTININGDKGGLLFLDDFKYTPQSGGLPIIIPKASV